MKQDNLIELEESNLEKLEKEKDNLKRKWFKLSSTQKLISFLEYYCKEKKKLITKLKEFEG